MGNNKSSHKLTREEKEKAVELAIAGKDPIGYLKECGAKNPWASWAYIKNVLKKSKPELYAQLPGDDDRLGEEVSFGAQGIQTAAAGGDPSTAPDGSAQDDKVSAAGDPLEGFVAFDPGAPEGDKAADLVINAEDLAAAEDPAVKRMEALAAVTKTDRVLPVAGRLVMDEHGLHTVKAEDPPKPEKSWLAEIAEKVPDVDAGERPAAVARDPSTSVGMTAQGVLHERSELIHDAHGVRMVTDRLLDDLPCVITGLKVNEFEFNLNRAGMVLILPESDRDFLQLQVTLKPDQWRRLVEVVPKVMKILRIE